MTQQDLLVKKKNVVFAELTAIRDSCKNMTAISAEVKMGRVSKLEDIFRNLQMEIIEYNIDKTDRSKKVNETDFPTFTVLIEFINEKCLEKMHEDNPQPGPSSATAPQEKLNLPKLAIPVFEGNIQNWNSFITLYDSLIHTANIDKVRKLQYLLAYTAKEANAIVARFELNAENYDSAYKALQNRYANKRRLAAHHIQKIVNSASAKDLSAFLEINRSASAALVNLQVEDLADFIMFQLVYNRCKSKEKETFDNEMDDELPKLSDLLNHIEKRVRSQELELDANPNPNPRANNTRANPVDTAARATKSRTYVTQSEERQCIYCKEDHAIFSCAGFKQLPVEDRINFVKNNRLCYNCLGNHVAFSCQSKSKCRECSRKHHTYLHLSDAPNRSSYAARQFQVQVSQPAPNCGYHVTPQSAPVPAAGHSATSVSGHAMAPATAHTAAARGAPPSSPPNPSPAPAKPSDSCLALTSSAPKCVLLATVRCLIKDSFGNYHPARALLDNASQRSLVTARLVKRLGLVSSIEKRSIVGVNGRETQSLGCVIMNLASRYAHEETLCEEATVLPAICGDLPSVQVPYELYLEYKHLELADPQFTKPQGIDILLGAQAYAQLLTQESPNLLPGFPTALRTRFGWVIFGATEDHSCPTATSVTLLTQSQTLDASLTRFWEIEEVVQPVSKEDPEEAMAEAHFLSTHSRDADGRYVLRLPFRPGAEPEKLKNRNSAEGCLMALERRLNRNPPMKEKYTAFMQEFLDLKHMQPAKTPGSYVLPHHCVLKESTTTKLRCVFNASAKDQTGTSLNMLLLPGGKLQSDIADILLRFRFHAVALCSDIKMMFRMFAIHSEDSQFQRVLWRPAPDSEIVEFVITRLVYGMTSSSFLAQRTLRQVAKDEGHRFPEAAVALLRDFYMDDYVGGAASVEKARELRTQLTALLDSACLPLRKWSCSHPEVLDDVPASHKEIPLDFLPEDSVVKILGLCYLPSSDAFSYRVKPFDGPATKRSVLSYISRCYDPLGLLCGVICLAKQYIQKLWLMKLDWDEPLSEPLLSNWMCFLSTMNKLSELKIPRCLPIANAKLRLICFADASGSAYAGTVYLQIEHSDRIETQLIKAKSRVAPLKVQSIPRLELLAALLASRLLQTVITATPDRHYDEIYMFTDSTIVLAWLATPPHTLNTFVANRVVEINELTADCKWDHVRSELNPADCASRGLTPDQLVKHSLWWHGPPFLQDSPKTWPRSLPAIPEEIPECKKVTLVVTEPPPNTAEILMRYSSLERLLRITGWINRYIQNTKLKKEDRIRGNLSPAELEKAMRTCVYLAQSTDIQKLQSTKQLEKLTPFKDENGLVRVGGRLRHSLLESASKHPYLLPKNSRLSEMLVDYYHKILLHAGPRQTQSMIQRKFWIISAHTMIRKRIHQCRQCFRLTAKPLQPIMADLPPPRVQPAPAFWATATDFAGPFEVKETARRNSPRSKAYACIFVCMASKAVHIELTSELTTAAFLAAFQRFCSRRSYPATLISDQGRNYIGASRKLKEIAAFLRENQNEIFTKLASLSIDWRFNPPAAPNFGGLFEAAVKSMKLLLYRQIGATVLTFEEMTTLLARIEAILNSRPLGDFSSDIRDGTDMLTPGHLLVGRPLVSPPEEILEERDLNIGARWKRVQAHAQLFWRRWSREYLHCLIQRQKWTRHAPNPKVGDIVYITGLATSPLSWPLGMIDQIHPSSDGVVRVVTVRTSAGTYTRPTNRLVFPPVPVPLPQPNSTQD